MTTKHAVAERLITPIGEARYAWLDKPDSSPMGKNKFKCGLVLEKGVAENDAFAKKLNDLHKSVKGKAARAPVKDGDKMAEEDGEKYAWAAGKWILVSKSKDKPKVVNSAKKPCDVARSGDLVRLSIYVQDYPAKDGGTPGVTSYLNAVQLLERRNFGRSDEDAFDDVSDKYKADESEPSKAAPQPDTDSSTGDDDEDF